MSDEWKRLLRPGQYSVIVRGSDVLRKPCPKCDGRKCAAECGARYIVTLQDDGDIRYSVSCGISWYLRACTPEEIEDAQQSCREYWIERKAQLEAYEAREAHADDVCRLVDSLAGLSVESTNNGQH